jgi:hypothetical protein
MMLAGQQPNYLPWIGFFHKVSEADALVLVDHVQYEKRGITNSNAVKSGTARVELTVPVLSSGRFDQAIRDVQINNAIPWKRKHWRTISLAYGKAAHWAEHEPFFRELYETEWDRLAALNEAIIRYMLKAFGLERPVLVSSELPSIDGAKTGLLVSLCRAAGASGYISGGGARKYVDEDVFRAEGLAHRFQEFHHPVYPQGPGPFLPNLSAVDLLFREGPRAGEIIRSSGAPDPQRPIKETS